MTLSKPRSPAGWLLVSLLAAVVGAGSLALRSVLAEEAAEPAATAADASSKNVPSEQQAANEDDRIEIDEDLQGKVEVFLSSALRPTGRTRYYVTARIENVSDEALQAPIRIAILGTEVEGLEVQDAHGSLDAGEPFFDLIEDGKQLAPGAKSRTLKILFDSGEKRLTPAAIREFELTGRITREGLSYVEGRSEKVRDHVAQDDGKKSKDDRPLDGDHPEVQKVMTAQNRLTDRLMEDEDIQKDIHGTVTTLDRQGRLVIKVYITRASIADKLPRESDGVPVIAEVGGAYRARYFVPGDDNRGQAGRPLEQPPTGPCSVVFPPCDPETDPQVLFQRPVPIGVQISNLATLTGLGCSVGTLGCRVKRSDGTVYILSNNHVIGRENDAAPGEQVVQPGCGNAPVDTIARVSQVANITFTPTANNRIDAAIARTSITDIERLTPCFGYGVPKDATVKATLGMKVQKLGRTTNLTKGTVTGLNATVVVTFGKGPARFVGQIEISPGTFSDSGDSGSLIVSDPGLNPVGLLFAGNATSTIANPIDEVLARFNVTIDGDCE